MSFTLIITKGKEHGGLGIKKMQEMNLAFMSKLGWKVLTNKESLWAKTLICKYVRGPFNLTKLKK